MRSTELDSGSPVTKTCLHDLPYTSDSELEGDSGSHSGEEGEASRKILHTRTVVVAHYVADKGRLSVV